MPKQKSEQKEVKKYLKEKNIEFRKFSHPPVYTCEEAEKYNKEIRGPRSKNLFLKDRKSKNFYLVIISSNKKLEMDELGEKIGEKLKFANKKDLKNILNLSKGAVSPFGLINDKENKTNIIIDREIWDSDFVSFHPNVNTETLELPKKSFHKYIKKVGNEYEVIKLISDSPKQKSKQKTKVKIGLEIHGYLQTREKLFCDCKAVRHAKKQDIEPNTHTCPICTGYPGAKPMLPNEEAIKKIIQIGLMLGCDINTIQDNKQLVWNRKHYDWPDLPKGYQDTISGAYTIPVVEEGEFEKIGIKEAHLEEDPAQWDPKTGRIDYNRSGLPLIEIVTKPDFTNGEEVEEWLNELLLTLSYIKAVDKNAGIKADVNVSTGGERVEIKNVSSITDIKNAIEYEIKRQKDKKVNRETRRYDNSKGKTILMRKKESQADYRFIPDPDLPVLKLKDKQVYELKKELPETPKEKLEKLQKKHKIDKEQAEILRKNFELVEFFEEVAEKAGPKLTLPWITIELKRVLNYNDKSLEEVEINPKHFSKLLKMVKDDKITENQAKKVLNKFIPKSFDPEEKLKGKGKITKKSKLKKIVKKVLKKNKQAAQDYKAGDENAINYLIGQVMKQTKGRADNKKVRRILDKELKNHTTS